MTQHVDRIKQQWLQLNITEKKEFVMYISNSTSRPILENAEKFSANSTMRFGDANTCPTCGK